MPWAIDVRNRESANAANPFLDLDSDEITLDVVKQCLHAIKPHINSDDLKLRQQARDCAAGIEKWMVKRLADEQAAAEFAKAADKKLASRSKSDDLTAKAENLELAICRAFNTLPPPPIKFVRHADLHKLGQSADGLRSAIVRMVANQNEYEERVRRAERLRAAAMAERRRQAQLADAYTEGFALRAATEAQLEELNYVAAGIDDAEGFEWEYRE